MSGRKDDPDLAPDAALAVEHTPEREADQWAHLGGEKDDIDEFDPSDLDDGSVLPDDYDPLNPAPAASQDDEEDDAKEDTEDDSSDTDDSEDDDSADDGDGDEAEEDSEDADDADADADSDDADEDADEKPAAKGIPKHRFDEVNERRKSAEEENARLKAQIEAGKPPEDEAEPYDVRANEKEYMDLLLDGDTESALAKREEIDAAKYASWKAETQVATKTDISQDAEQQELLHMSKEAETMFDVFNPDHEDYNQGMLNKVLTFMRGYESTGEMSRGDAFVAGLADVVEMYDLMPDEDDTPADDGKPKPTGKKKVDPKKAGLKKKAHVPVAGEGAASADSGAVVPDIETMTDEEIDALPEKTLARLRGDFV